MRTMKALLVTPPYHAGVVESAGRWMPLSFVYLAGAARSAGWEVEIYDAMTKQHTLEQVAAHLSSSDADLLAVSAITSSIPAALDVLRRMKKHHPGAITVLGGVHPSFCYDELFREHGECIDFIVCGEGEKTFPALLTAIRQATDPAGVRGIAFLRGGRVVRTAHQAFVTDLDELPAAWDAIAWSDYRYFVIPGSRLAAISTSRGCTHGCTFCSQQKFWQRTWRARRPQRVVDEIEMLNRTYGANVFLLVDEYPTLDRGRWEEFLDRLISRNLGVYLLMETRVEDIVRDRDILWKYRKAGIIHIYIGVEATDQATLDRMNKQISVDQSQEAIRLIHEHRMISETSFVLGFPDETAETISRTLALAQRYNPDFAHFLAITPWPYADLYEETKAFIAVTDYASYNLVEPIIRPRGLSLRDVRRAIVDCYRNYYMRKAPEYYRVKDPFKREYLKRSMHLIMRNSFLTRMLRESGFSETDFAVHHPAAVTARAGDALPRTVHEEEGAALHATPVRTRR